MEVMHWNDALVLHALARKTSSAAGLRRFDPASNGTAISFPGSSIPTAAARTCSSVG